MTALDPTDRVVVVSQGLWPTLLQAMRRGGMDVDAIPTRDFQARQYRATCADPVPQLAEPLTDREFQVLLGMSRGKSNGDIGRSLCLSEDSIKTYARRLFRKLHVHNRAHAVHVGHLLGLLGEGVTS